MAAATCWRIARSGRFVEPIAIIVSILDSASRGVFAWTVVSDPSWPVFIACSMSSASSPRVSPTTMRSGRMRRALMSSCRWRIAPLPSTFGGRVSRRATCSWCSWSSAASSMVTMRSRSEMNADSTFSSVVLPAPVPPLISMFSLDRTQCSRNSSIGRVIDRMLTRSWALRRSAGKRRIDSSGPSTARVDHRRTVVDATADAADDAVDDAHQVLVVLERRRQPFELALALDVHVLVGVDQDVAHRGVAQQRLERAQPEDFVDDVGEEGLALAHAERGAFLGDQLEEQRPNLRFGARAVRGCERLEVQAVQQLSVNVGLELEVPGPGSDVDG